MEYLFFCTKRINGDYFQKKNKINVVFYLLNNLKKNFSPIHLGDSS